MISQSRATITATMPAAATTNPPMPGVPAAFSGLLEFVAAEGLLELPLLELSLLELQTLSGTLPGVLPSHTSPV